MAREKRETIMKSVGILLAERMGLQKKERKFVRNVNAMLRKSAMKWSPGTQPCLSEEAGGGA